MLCSKLHADVTGQNDGIDVLSTSYVEVMPMLICMATRKTQATSSPNPSREIDSSPDLCHLELAGAKVGNSDEVKMI